MIHATRPRLFVLLALAAAACTGGPGTMVHLGKTLQPSRRYTVDAYTETRSAIEITRMPGLEQVNVGEQHSSTSRSRQVLTSGPLEGGAFSLRLETLGYEGTEDSVMQSFDLSGVYGLASFDSTTRAIALTSLEGECRDSMLTREDVGGYLANAYQAIQGSLLDTLRTFTVGSRDTVSGMQLHPMGPLNMTLMEYSVFTLDRVEGDSAWFRVDRWAELVPDSTVTAANTVVEGRGSGTMVFHIPERYVVDTRLTTDLKVTHTTDSLSFVATSGSRVEVTTVIAPVAP